MSDRPNSDYCREFSMPLATADAEDELNRIILSIAKEDPNGTLRKLYAIYAKFPPVAEGLHQLEEMGIYGEELLQISLLHRDLSRAIAERTDVVSIDKASSLWPKLRSTYEKMRMLEPKM